MKKLVSVAAVLGLAVTVAACKPAPTTTQAEPEKAPATGEEAAAQQQPATQQAPAETPENTAKEKGTPPDDNPATEATKEAAEEAPEDPDDDSTWGSADADKIDRDKLALAYTEVYCAQKKGEMDKLLDIYKTHGFEKPEDFISTWVEAARDTAWVTRVATDAAAKCK